MPFSISTSRSIHVTVVALLLAVGGNMLMVFALKNHSSVSVKNVSSRSNLMIADVSSIKEQQKTFSSPQKNPESKTSPIQRPHQIKTNEDKSIIDAPIYNPIYYFKTNEVSQKPRVVIDLPSTFFLPKSTQRLAMTLFISDTGEVEDVLLSTNDFDSNDREIIIAAFKTMHFEPALIGNVAVPSEMQIEVFGNNIE